MSQPVHRLSQTLTKVVTCTAIVNAIKVPVNQATMP